jgi:hypothetical protein
MIHSYKLKNTDKVVTVCTKSKEHLESNPYFNEIRLMENLRVHSAGYAVFARNIPQKDGTYKNETIYLHKYLGEKFITKPPSSQRLFVSFKNNNPLDCRLENLEWVSMSMLRRNQSKSSNKTGYRGVVKTGKRYHAFIYDGKKRIELGSYNSAEEAAEAYNKKSVELFGNTKGLNQILRKNIST